jgi:hypothetical protein
MRLPSALCGSCAFVFIGACAGQPPPGPRLRYDTPFPPEEYTPTERVVGAPFAAEFDQVVFFFGEEGKARYEAEGRFIEVAWPADDPRPVLPLRLTGPGGTIERTFHFSTGFGAPVFLPRGDAEELGLPGHPAATKALLVGGSEQRECWQASLEVEFPGLGLKRTVPVLWSASAP